MTRSLSFYQTQHGTFSATQCHGGRSHGYSLRKHVPRYRIQMASKGGLCRLLQLIYRPPMIEIISMAFSEFLEYRLLLTIVPRTRPHKSIPSTWQAGLKLHAHNKLRMSTILLHFCPSQALGNMATQICQAGFPTTERRGKLHHPG